VMTMSSSRFRSCRQAYLGGARWGQVVRASGRRQSRGGNDRPKPAKRCLWGPAGGIRQGV